jgi:hypothetical protein
MIVAVERSSPHAVQKSTMRALGFEQREQIFRFCCSAIEEDLCKKTEKKKKKRVQPFTRFLPMRLSSSPSSPKTHKVPFLSFLEGREREREEKRREWVELRVICC